MGLITQPTIKKIDKEEIIMDKKSDYCPDKLVLERQKDVIKDYLIANNYIEETWEEFNGNTVYDRASKDQEMFNGNTPTPSGDPNEYWKANTVNPMTRNRCISIMAHLIQSYQYPLVVAQNEQSEEDKDASLVFSTITEWCLDQAKYPEVMMSMLYAFISEPITCVKVDYINAKRKIKTRKGKDGYSFKEVPDEDFGGFQLDIIPFNEIFFGNVHEPNVQKQPFIITRRILDYTQAESKYGKTENWQYVKPGLYTFLFENDETFYEKDDEDLTDSKVYEDVYYNKSADLELVYINGILVHNDPDRPLQRDDKKYPFAISGYEKIHNRMIYYKSLVSKLAATQIDLNDLWNAVKDMARYQATPATFSYGFEEMDSSVVIPGMNTNTQSKEAGIVPINNGSDLSGALRVISMLEGAQNEGSQAPLQSGIGEGGQKTKYEVQRLESNANTVLGLSGEMLASIVKQIGELMLGLALQHLPITEVSQIIDGDTEIKMIPIVVPQKGAKKSRKVEFTDDMPVNEDDEFLRSLKILDEETSKGMTIFKINPELINKLKFLVKVESQYVDRNSKINKAISLYDRMLANPITQQNPEVLESVTKDLLLGQLVPGEEYKYLPGGNDPIETLAEDIMTNKPAQSKQPNPMDTKINLNTPKELNI